MNDLLGTAVLVVKTAILLLGSGIAYIAYRAHRGTNDDSLRALSIGFGVVTLGALLAGFAHRILDVSLRAGVLVDGLLTAIGFAIIIYSLYLDA